EGQQSEGNTGRREKRPVHRRIKPVHLRIKSARTAGRGSAGLYARDVAAHEAKARRPYANYVVVADTAEILPSAENHHRIPVCESGAGAAQAHGVLFVGRIRDDERMGVENSRAPDAVVLQA